jgi:phage N-6-adenine-methyltransferase
MLLGFSINNHPQQVGKRGAKDTVDERITPPAIFDPLNAEFRFTLDAAANERNRKTRLHFDRISNGLSQSWQHHRVWCNPPYSDIRPWVEKAWAEHRVGCPLIVMLLPANRTEQRWWQDLIEPFRDGRGPLETRFYRGRFNFGLPDNPEGKFHSSPPFGCALVIWRAAIAIETATAAETENTGSARKGESAGPKGIAHKGSSQ